MGFLLALSDWEMATTKPSTPLRAISKMACKTVNGKFLSTGQLHQCMLRNFRPANSPKEKHTDRREKKHIGKTLLAFLKVFIRRIRLTIMVKIIFAACSPTGFARIQISI